MTPRFHQPARRPVEVNHGSISSSSGSAHLPNLMRLARVEALPSLEEVKRDIEARSFQGPKRDVLEVRGLPLMATP